MSILARLTPDAIGPSTGRPVVLAQPPGVDRSVWGGVGPHLASRHRVICFSYPQTALAGADLASCAADLLELADALRLAGAIHVGIGAAASIAREVDRLGPGRFGLLVAVDPDVPAMAGTWPHHPSAPRHAAERVVRTQGGIGLDRQALDQLLASVDDRAA